MNVESGRYFFSQSQVEPVMNLCSIHDHQAVDDVLCRADAAVDNRFYFNWMFDMEPCSDVVALPLPIDWTYCHNNDLEWTYMLNRMKFMEDLAFAALYKGDNRYRDAFEFFLENWMRQHGDGEDAVVWRKIDCALRIVHLIRAKAFLCACESWNNRCESLFRRLADQTSEYLLTSFTSVDAQSNWGFIETNALIQLAITKNGHVGFADTIKKAMSRLELMVTLQIGGDGVHLEQSPGYHHEVLRNLFESVHLSELNGIQVPVGVKEGLKRMFKASARMIRPDGSQPQFGDSDILDIRPFMALAAYRYQDEPFVPLRLRTVTFDMLWYTAGDIIYQEGWSTMGSEGPLKDWLEDSGLQIARSGWERHSDYVCMNAGEMGLSAHGHDDLTHFEWVIEGVPFVISTGRGTYRESPLREQLKTAKGHNMVIIDDTMPSTYGDTWSWLQEATPVNAKMTSANGFTYMRAGHDGYLSLQSGGLITREVILTPRGSLVVIDSILGGGSHRYQQAFHVSERFTIGRQKGQTLEFNHASLSIKMQQCAPVDKMVVHKDLYSPRYNEVRESHVIVSNVQTEGHCRFVTVFGKGHQGFLEAERVELFDKAGKLADQKDHTSLRLHYGGAVETLVISHKGRRYAAFEGQQFTDCVWFRSS